MPTYIPIDKTILTSTQTTVTFSSIPTTYTDLLLRVSVRSTGGGTGGGSGWLRVNGLSTSIYSEQDLRGTGSAAAASESPASSIAYWSYHVGGPSALANTFSNTEIYIPGYQSSTNKQFYSDNAQENNTTQAFRSIFASLMQTTAVISSISIACDSGDWASGSTFYLYGISNA
jgi:hypothetical protein